MLGGFLRVPLSKSSVFLTYKPLPGYVCLANISGHVDESVVL